MLSVIKRPIFKLSFLSAGAVLLAATFYDRLWSETHIACVGVMAVLGLAYLVMLCWGLVFWIEKRHYRKAYLPFTICVTAGMLIWLLPLNQLLDRTEFKLARGKYEQAAIMAVDNQAEGENYLYNLPGKYRLLSAGGGQAVVLQKNARAVFFYTYHDSGSKKGFVKLLDGQRFADCSESLCANLTMVRPMGNNWYYIAGDE